MPPVQSKLSQSNPTFFDELVNLLSKHQIKIAGTLLTVIVANYVIKSKIDPEKRNKILRFIRQYSNIGLVLVAAVLFYKQYLSNQTINTNTTTVANNNANRINLFNVSPSMLDIVIGLLFSTLINLPDNTIPSITGKCHTNKFVSFDAYYDYYMKNNAYKARGIRVLLLIGILSIIAVNPWLITSLTFSGCIGHIVYKLLIGLNSNISSVAELLAIQSSYCIVNTIVNNDNIYYNDKMRIIINLVPFLYYIINCIVDIAQASSEYKLYAFPTFFFLSELKYFTQLLLNRMKKMM